METVSLSAGEQPDFLLLIGALEVEARQIRAAVELLLADHDHLLAAGDLLPRGDVAVERATLIGVRDLHSLADLQRSRIRRLLIDDHLEQRRFAGAGRTNDADDAAARQRETQSVDQQLLAKRFSKLFRRDDVVAESGRRRDDNFVLHDLFGRLFGDHLLVLLHTRLVLRLARAGRESHPIELALQRALPRRLGFFSGREARFLLLKPRGVVALVRNAVAAIELEDPAGDVVEEVAVVSDGDDGPLEVVQIPLEPGDAFG